MPIGLRPSAEFLHVKPGKGAAFVRTKMRNYITGNTVEKTFRAGVTVMYFILHTVISLSCVSWYLVSSIQFAMADI